MKEKAWGWQVNEMQNALSWAAQLLMVGLSSVDPIMEKVIKDLAT